MMLISAVTTVYLIVLSTSGKSYAKAEVTEHFRVWKVTPASRKAATLRRRHTSDSDGGGAVLPICAGKRTLRCNTHLGRDRQHASQPQSYVLSDWSWLWASQSGIFAGLPMRHEHQMFFGAVPILLAFVGVDAGWRHRDSSPLVLVGGALVVLAVLTLYVGGFSLWYVFARLPLASAIRAMTRIDLVLLFPIAFLGAVAIDQLSIRGAWGYALVVVGFVLFMVEFNGDVALGKLEGRMAAATSGKRSGNTGSVTGQSGAFLRAGRWTILRSRVGCDVGCAEPRLADTERIFGPLLPSGLFT